MTRTYDVAEARARVAHWQRRLRLTDWTIHVSIVRAHVLGPPLTLGEVRMLEVKQIANIRLLDPVDFHADAGFVDEQDHELTIIHELLHVRLRGVQADSVALRELLEEQAVYALSLALVADGPE